MVRAWPFGMRRGRLSVIEPGEADPENPARGEWCGVAVGRVYDAMRTRGLLRSDIFIFFFAIQSAYRGGVMGQCTIRWSNGHCAWSILPVGEANGNFLVRQAIQRLLSVGWGAFWQLACLAQRTPGGLPVRAAPPYPVSVARFFAGPRPRSRGPGAPA